MTNNHNPSDRPGSAEMPGNQASEDGESMRSERSPGGFTEGPWNSGPMNPFAVDAPNGELICETEDEANARLIAQAPEMFHLLEEIIEILGAAGVYKNSRRVEIVGPEDVIERLVAFGPKVGQVFREVRGE